MLREVRNLKQTMSPAALAVPLTHPSLPPAQQGGLASVVLSAEAPPHRWGRGWGRGDSLSLACGVCPSLEERLPRGPEMSGTNFEVALCGKKTGFSPGVEVAVDGAGEDLQGILGSGVLDVRELYFEGFIVEEIKKCNGRGEERRGEVGRGREGREAKGEKRREGSEGRGRERKPSGCWNGPEGGGHTQQGQPGCRPWSHCKGPQSSSCPSGKGEWKEDSSQPDSPGASQGRQPRLCGDHSVTELS